MGEKEKAQSPSAERASVRKVRKQQVTMSVKRQTAVLVNTKVAVGERTAEQRNICANPSAQQNATMHRALRTRKQKLNCIISLVK